MAHQVFFCARVAHFLKIGEFKAKGGGNCAEWEDVKHQDQDIVAEAG
jgi:hypothetical protein